MSRNVAALWVFVGICLGVEFVSGFATRQSVSTWYVTLDKPPWTPPGWIFPFVWTLLYVAMGVAAWLVWQRGPSPFVTTGLALFAAQLALNGCWSFFFFGLRNVGLGLVDIVLLLLVLLATLLWFWKIRPLAGALLVPYAAWIGFASALNYSIWRLNP